MNKSGPGNEKALLMNEIFFGYTEGRRGDAEDHRGVYKSQYSNSNGDPGWDLEFVTGIFGLL
jgi:hypothetical protein